MTAASFLNRHGNCADNIDAEQVVSAFIAEMRAGLAGGQSSVAMLPTYLDGGALPSDGKYIVIDAGGTNFRSGIGVITAGGVDVTDEQAVPMPATYGRMTADEFYSAIAQNVKRLLPEARDIGFCFSFPVRMEENGDGEILSMPKGIDATEIIGTKVGERTLAAIKELDCTERKIVILNDTAAALLGAAGADIGYIYGTGTNVCCQATVNGKQMLINTECGNFDKFPRGDFETTVAQGTPNPREYVLEKAVAGRYLAGVVAQAFQTACKENVISASTQIPSFTLAELSDFLSGAQNGISRAFTTDCDRQTARQVAVGIVERAAKLGAVANAAAAIFGQKPNVVIVAEGTTFYKLKGYKESFEKYLGDILFEHGVGFKVIQGKGNLHGALAAIAARQ
ncbi:MAG: hypothetical protein K2M89_04600 [Clostridiales bacterium]|nr:hypothetical protein [Clostridiales bacterium]